MVNEAAGRSEWSTRTRLAAMMMLIYAVLGAWWPLLAVHLRDLGVSGRGQGWIFATMALASLATPLGVGHLADRRWPTQRLLAVIYGLGSGLLVVLALGLTRDGTLMFFLFLAYWLLSAPAYGLSASLAFRNLARPHEEFGSVRLWGTVGWMVIGWVVSAVMMAFAVSGQGAAPAFWVAAGVSVVASLYCLTLPNTPPLGEGGWSRAQLAEGIDLLRRPGVAIFLVSAFAVCLTTPYVYQVLPPYLRHRGFPVSWIPLVLTLGQVPEIIALGILPRIMGRIGYRGTLALGIAAWTVRFGTLAFEPPLWVVLAGIPLHGVAIASFHIGGQLFLDSQAPPHRRASVQGIFVLVTSGIGALVGNVLAGELSGLLGTRYGLVFLVPALINLVTLVLFVAAFPPAVATSSTKRQPSAGLAMARGRLAPDALHDAG